MGCPAGFQEQHANRRFHLTETESLGNSLVPEMKIKIPPSAVPLWGSASHIKTPVWLPRECCGLGFSGTEATCDPLVPTVTRGLLGPYMAFENFALAANI